MPRRFAWASLPDERLLQLRLKDLKVSIERTWLARCLRDLHDEIGERGLRIRPHAWISNEWFSPDDTPGIAIPFYLAHPRLMRLERKMMIDVEGGTVPECMRILRHETGHVVQVAYQLHRHRRWQRLFGRSSTRYPDYYRPNPGSRRYVQHLPLWYAQSHPDEDFAETFAVWLTPRSSWRRRYAGWPALKKLEYVDELMGEIAGKRPLVTRRLNVEPLSRLTQTLGRALREEARALRGRPSGDLRPGSAAALLRRSEALAVAGGVRVSCDSHRAMIRQIVSKWTGEYQLTLDAVLDDMIGRCRELNLRAVGSERQLRMEFIVLLTAKTVHSLYSPSRRQWLAL